jgi:hypothetical protein
MGRPYTLGIHLADVGQSLGQDVSRHLVTVFVSELCSFSLSTLRKCSGIRNRACDDASDGGGDLEDVGDR